MLNRFEMSRCLLYLATKNLANEYRQLKPVTDAIESLIDVEACRMLEPLLDVELVRSLTFKGRLSNLLAMKNIDDNVLREYVENFIDVYKWLEKEVRDRDAIDAFYLAIWIPVLKKPYDERYALIASLFTSLVQAAWISTAKKIGVLVLEFINKGEALASTRIPRDVLAVSGTLSSLVIYATSRLAHILSPFLVLRPAPALNTFYYPEELLRKLENSAVSQLYRTLIEYGLSIHPAIGTAIVPLEGPLTFDAHQVLETVVESLRKAWSCIVDHVLNELSKFIKEEKIEEKKCLETVRVELMLELIKRSRYRPAYQFVVSMTEINIDDLKRSGSNVSWDRIVERYTQGHEGAALNKYMWAPLYTLENIESELGVLGTNRLCTNCYRLLAIVAVKEEAEERRASPCIVGKLVLRPREKLCVYGLINRLIVNPFRVLASCRTTMDFGDERV